MVWGAGGRRKGASVLRLSVARAEECGIFAFMMFIGFLDGHSSAVRLQLRKDWIHQLKN